MEEQKTLFELLTELRGEVDVTVTEIATMTAEGEKFVTDNRSGLMSAFIKSMRMQKINQAVYWGWILLLGKQAPWYVSRRTLISAAEDGMDVDVFEYVSAGHYVKGNTNEHIMKQAIAVCLDKNWWNNQLGRKSMQLMFKSNKRETLVAATYEDALAQMDTLLFSGTEEDFMDAVNVQEGLGGLEGFSMDSYYAHLLKLLAKRFTETKDNQYTRMREALRLGMKDIVGYHDWNWSYAASFMISQGFCEPTDLSGLNSYEGLIEKIRVLAEHDLNALCVNVPPWAYDGLHASNKAISPWKDKRFAGTNSGFYNMILMFKENSRLDPRDQAALENMYVPEEGLVLGNDHVEAVTK